MRKQNVLKMGKAEETAGINNEFEDKIKGNSRYIFDTGYDRKLSDRNNTVTEPFRAGNSGRNFRLFI